ncbi:hypothetical protein Tco_0367748 [Tanacetum coccineum]
MLMPTSCIRSELLPEIVINDLSTRTCIFVCAKKLQPSSTLAAKSRFTPMNEHAISKSIRVNLVNNFDPGISFETCHQWHQSYGCKITRSRFNFDQKDQKTPRVRWERKSLGDSNRLQSTLEEEEEHESIEGTNDFVRAAGTRHKGKKETLDVDKEAWNKRKERTHRLVIKRVGRKLCETGNTDGYLEFVVEHGVEQKKENIEVYCGTTFWKRTTTTTIEKKELVWFVNRIEVDKKGRERVERREDSKNKT